MWRRVLSLNEAYEERVLTVEGDWNGLSGGVVGIIVHGMDKGIKFI